jgi:hypothetical protein
MIGRLGARWGADAVLAERVDSIAVVVERV